MNLNYDIAVIGGGLGGIAAAIAAARNGKKVFLSEETTWLGGQATTQGVPLDEHNYIEDYGRTELYNEYRKNIRKYYKQHYPLKDSQKENKYLNPGNSWVSVIGHEPIVSKMVLELMIHPYIISGMIDLYYKTKPISSIVENHTIKTVILDKDGESIQVDANYFIDATEEGDLLPITNTEYVTGSEGFEETKELHQSPKKNPLDMQAITWCFAVSLEDEGDYTIEKPKLYEYFKNHRSDFWPGSQLSWTYSEPSTLKPIEGSMTKEENKVDLFTYRRILDRNNFKDGYLSGDVIMVNWPQNDYWLGPVIDVSDLERNHHLYRAKELSKSLLYWLQTEADGKGYPNLKPRGDVLGTKDGFAMKPYIREARRIVPEFKILESHIGAKMRDDGKSEVFFDSIGIGYYHIDLHPSTGMTSYVDIENYPFQIPMGALIPIKTKNLIPASKNIGTSHITNGCYRVHPVEWNIGESAAMMASYSIDNNIGLKELRNTPKHLKKFQEMIIDQGIETEWPSHLVGKKERSTH